MMDFIMIQLPAVVHSGEMSLVSEIHDISESQLQVKGWREGRYASSSYRSLMLEASHRDTEWDTALYNSIHI